MLYIRIYSSYNWKSVLFDQHFPIPPTPAPGNHHSSLCFPFGVLKDHSGCAMAHGLEERETSQCPPSLQEPGASQSSREGPASPHDLAPDV